MSAQLCPTDTVPVPLDRIASNADLQTRVKIHTSVVRAYAAAMKEQLIDGGLKFPPVVLFTDGNAYWLSDGFHRVLAARQAGLTEIQAEVRSGGRRDALLYGLSANNFHGLPRTNADKRKAVECLLADPEWSQWSDREIARRCQVGHRFVGRMRSRASGSGIQIATRKVQRGGTVYEMEPRNGSAAHETASEAPPSIAVDAVGLLIPGDRERLFAALPDFEKADELFRELSDLLNRIAQGPGGEAYRRDLLGTLVNGKPGYACPALRASRGKLLAARPYCAYCPACHAMPMGLAAACKACGGRRWTTQPAFESCSQADRERLLRANAAAAE
jgi:ParB-like nuclease domain